MKLDEFIRAEQETLERFAEHWIESRRKSRSPDQDWPMDMGAGEWFEKLIAFQTTGKS